jgi:wyosine [tRNA(Phe)-imidazoG37] synthetase (radical SAM superfamily)
LVKHHGDKVMTSIVYGPVPSRRLGQSMGINNIPPKICSYSCVYCQLGDTIKMEADRRTFYGSDKICGNIREKVDMAKQQGYHIDYLTFVPDGEPTLDADIGEEINYAKSTGIKTAVITNSSLIWRDDVRLDLCKADWMSIKIDAVSEDIWRKVDRPHRSLNLNKILEGILLFKESFKGFLTTETMLIKGLNDGSEELRSIADFLEHIQPDTAYLAVPTRPPASNQITGADEKQINEGFQIFSQKLKRVEYLIGYEGNDFCFSGDIENDLLSITSVHPMRSDAVDELLLKSKSDWSIIEKLIKQSKLIELEYKGKKYYMRKLPGSGKRI